MFLKWLQAKKDQKSEMLTKYLLCQWKYKPHESKCKSNKKWNNDKCQHVFVKMENI